jgi:ribonuclease P protein component
VRLRADYLAIQNRGRRVGGTNLLVFALAGSGRMGITVSRKVGGAVVRNRVKRWIRECYRRRQTDFPGQVDFVVVARPAAAGAGHTGICRELAALARRLGGR